ncbi:hypothetical protein PT279_05680 [Bifidobacterium sp. ESL0784]|uniref:hypothetical protein n=1 Tax=Bifidobacterium sp. ESL0784 TaxID=2983231 RepID=UPI0023F6F65B|nr:hypothetical protein [Bifidobacterium sp. ESL0784]MDF7641078.1 hypothetical protein [Bifidobacterium sp. ESL0784]
MVKQLVPLGFVGPFDSRIGGIGAYRPTFAYGLDSYVALKNDWSFNKKDSYATLSESDKKYTNAFSSKLSQQLRLSENDLVWACSKEFYDSVTHCVDRIIEVFDMTRWIPYINGSYISIGSSWEYISFSKKMFSIAAKILNKGLGEQNGVGITIDDKLNNAFSVLDQIQPCKDNKIGRPSENQYIERGLFYYKTEGRDSTNYRLVASDAADFFTKFENKKIFDLRVDLAKNAVSEIEDADELEPTYYLPTDDYQKDNFHEVLNVFSDSYDLHHKSKFQNSDSELLDILVSDIHHSRILDDSGDY